MEVKIFIQQHRNAFDLALPDAHCWQGVVRVLNRLPHADALERTVLLDRLLLDTQMPSDQVWAGICAGLENCEPSTPDPLEQFISTNRIQFDAAEPDLNVWRKITGVVDEAAPNIAKRLEITHNKPAQRRFSAYFLRAAAAIALLITGMGAGFWYAQSSRPSEMAMSEVSSEYAELEHYYQRDIAAKQQRLANFTGSIQAGVTDDMADMDRVMAELRLEMVHLPPGNREEVVRAMIENYKTKAKILERVLQRLEQHTPKTNQQEQQHDSKTKNI